MLPFPAFSLERPNRMDDLLDLAAVPGSRLVAGGTDVLVSLIECPKRVSASDVTNEATIALISWILVSSSTTTGVAFMKIEQGRFPYSSLR